MISSYKTKHIPRWAWRSDVSFWEKKLYKTHAKEHPDSAIYKTNKKFSHINLPNSGMKILSIVSNIHQMKRLIQRTLWVWWVGESIEEVTGREIVTGTSHFRMLYMSAALYSHIILLLPMLSTLHILTSNSIHQTKKQVTIHYIRMCIWKLLFWLYIYIIQYVFYIYDY